MHPALTMVDTLTACTLRWSDLKVKGVLMPEQLSLSLPVLGNYALQRDLQVADGRRQERWQVGIVLCVLQSAWSVPTASRATRAHILSNTASISHVASSCLKLFPGSRA
jgi:hypothetical protein